MKVLSVPSISMALMHCMRASTGYRMHSQLSAAKLAETVRIPLRCSPVSEVSPAWFQSRIVHNRRNAEGLRSVDIEVSSDVHEQYRHPGQYLKVRRMDGGNPTLFSMASPPDNRNILSFLIKESPHHEFVLNMREGEQIDLSAPIGAGFRIEERIHQCRSDFHVNNILMIACGSGLAPIAAAIESNQLGLQQGDEDSVPSLSSLIAPPRTARLYIGARTPAHLPYADRYPTWREKGVEIIPVFSRVALPGGVASAAPRRHVQDALREDSVRAPRNTAALLCGMRDMTEAVRTLLLREGVPEQRILLNV